MLSLSTKWGLPLLKPSVEHYPASTLLPTPGGNTPAHPTAHAPPIHHTVTKGNRIHTTHTQGPSCKHAHSCCLTRAELCAHNTCRFLTLTMGVLRVLKRCAWGAGVLGAAGLCVWAAAPLMGGWLPVRAVRARPCRTVGEHMPPFMCASLLSIDGAYTLNMLLAG